MIKPKISPYQLIKWSWTDYNSQFSAQPGGESSILGAEGDAGLCGDQTAQVQSQGGGAEAQEWRPNQRGGHRQA